MMGTASGCASVSPVVPWSASSESRSCSLCEKTGSNGVRSPVRRYCTYSEGLSHPGQRQAVSAQRPVPEAPRVGDEVEVRPVVEVLALPGEEEPCLQQG